MNRPRYAIMVLLPIGIGGLLLFAWIYWVVGLARHTNEQLTKPFYKTFIEVVEFNSHELTDEMAARLSRIALAETGLREHAALATSVSESSLSNNVVVVRREPEYSNRCRLRFAVESDKGKRVVQVYLYPESKGVSVEIYREK